MVLFKDVVDICDCQICLQDTNGIDLEQYTDETYDIIKYLPVDCITVRLGMTKKALTRRGYTKEEINNG